MNFCQAQLQLQFNWTKLTLILFPLAPTQLAVCNSRGTIQYQQSLPHISYLFQRSPKQFLKGAPNGKRQQGKMTA